MTYTETMTTIDNALNSMTMIRKAHRVEKNFDTIVNRLRANGIASAPELRKMCKVKSIDSYIKALTKAGLIRTEVRREETRKIKMRGWLTPDHQPLPMYVWATLDNGERIRIPNPERLKSDTWGWYTDDVQIRRKYLIWLGE